MRADRLGATMDKINTRDNWGCAEKIKFINYLRVAGHLQWYQNFLW